MLTLTDDKLLKFVLIWGKSCVTLVLGEKLGWPRTLFIILLTAVMTIEKILFFTLLVVESQKKIWELRMKRGDEKFVSNTSLFCCSEHFAAKDYKKSFPRHDLVSEICNLRRKVCLSKFGLERFRSNNDERFGTLSNRVLSPFSVGTRHVPK